eukprot:CAMPEP_0113462780 /NCGR_PEP_ID=MMETSP0014_2-20120614/12288_1 /TAXON_ID=2857 /ORGANISM="Nitzschia sp." /LENGTH=362 /DNA_ID=CAMNT_0000354693 /DNA_START=42 /DNA_END=1131 /DNA_ORIENTATION=- /assembly_acc=CAM_ASM_000159
MKVGIPILALTAWVAFAEPEQHGTSTNKSWTGAHNEFFQCDLYHQQLFAAKMDTCIADFNVQTEKLKTQQTIYESKANDKMKELLLDFQKYFNEQFVDFKEEFVDFRKHVDERFDETTDGFNSRFDETTDGFNARFDEIYEKMTFYVTAAIYFGLFLVMLVIPSSHGVPFGDYVWMTYKHMRDSRDLIAIISLVVLPSLAMAFFAKWTSCFDSFLIDFCDRLPLPYLADEPVSTSTTTTAAPPATGDGAQHQPPPPPQQPQVQGHQQAQGGQQQQQQQPPPPPQQPQPQPQVQGHQQAQGGQQQQQQQPPPPPQQPQPQPQVQGHQQAQGGQQQQQQQPPPPPLQPQPQPPLQGHQQHGPNP